MPTATCSDETSSSAVCNEKYHLLTVNLYICMRPAKPGWGEASKRHPGVAHDAVHYSTGSLSERASELPKKSSVLSSLLLKTADKHDLGKRKLYTYSRSMKSLARWRSERVPLTPIVVLSMLVLANVEQKDIYLLFYVSGTR